MKITVKLDKQDVVSKGMQELVGCLQSIAGETEQEEPKKATPKKKAPAKEDSVEEKAAEPAKEDAIVKAEAPEPVKEEKPVEENAPEPVKAKVINLDEMKSRVMAIKDQDAGKWDGIKNLIKQYGGGKISAIPEDTREEFMAAVEAL